MRPLLLLLLSIAAAAQTSTPPASEPKPEILVLGAFHMANPGHDLANIQVDDVRSPQRQQQMAELLAVLKKFNPTKIAIESDVTGSNRPKEYEDYLAGKHELTRNEIEQIGFRLAKELGHKKIYPVDVDGDFPWMRVQNYAKANGQADKLDALTKLTQATAQESDAFLKSHTILQMMERVNSDENVARDMGWYYKVLRFGEPWEYAGPDLIASWYQRNVRIYSNVVKLADSPQERILVVYGYGHLGWLRQLAAADPNVRLRKLDEFAK